MLASWIHDAAEYAISPWRASIGCGVRRVKLAIDKHAIEESGIAAGVEDQVAIAKGVAIETFGADSHGGGFDQLMHMHCGALLT